MSKFLYKSKLLIIIYVTVTIILLMGMNIYQKSQSEGYKEATFLSQNYVKVKTKNYQIIYEVMSKSLNYPQKNIFMLNLGDGIEAVGYSDDKLFDIKLKSGRKFDLADFENKTDTVIVSETLYNVCEFINGTCKYFYENKYYDVIGVLDENTYDFVNSNIKLYINGYAENVINGFSYMVWDGGNDSEKYINEIITENQAEIISFGTEDYKRSSNMTMSGTFVVIIFLFMALIIFLNISEATKIWFDGRKKEYAIRMLLGERKKKAKRWVEIQYFIEVVLSITVGSMIAWIVIHIFTQVNVCGSAMRLLSPHIRIMDVLIVGGGVLIAGYLTCKLLLWGNLKKGVINILK